MLGFDGNVETVYQNGIPNSYSKISGLVSEYAIGSFDGNVFTGTYNGNGNSGEITITLNEDKSIITNMIWEGNTLFTNANVDLGFSCFNIPFRPNFEGVYYVSGSNTCNFLTSAYYTYTSDTKTSTLLTDYVCDELSFIDISFYKE
jgi:hypothetical protein